MMQSEFTPQVTGISQLVQVIERTTQTAGISLPSDVWAAISQVPTFNDQNWFIPPPRRDDEGMLLLLDLVAEASMGPEMEYQSDTPERISENSETAQALLGIQLGVIADTPE